MNSPNKKLTTLLNTNPAYESNPKENDDARHERFSSLTDFPNFLLQVLRVHTQSDVALDDKQLLTEFDKHLFNSKDNIENSLNKLKNFTYSLLKIKFLYDSYIIKRDFSKEMEGWYLLSLKFSNDNSSYVNTFEQNERDNSRQLILLLSAFHVSAPAKSYKYWLNGALKILVDSNENGLVGIKTYLDKLELLARKFMYGRFLELGKYSAESKAQQLNYHEIIYNSESRYHLLTCDDTSFKEKLSYGNIQNNFVFNYVNYLIWRDYEKSELDGHKVNTTSKFTEIRDNFKFTFRSSVEHFAPQAQKFKTEEIKDYLLHSFGNLCLISHSQNSILSNNSPSEKYKYYYQGLIKSEIGSLKLYLMLELMKVHGNIWGEAEIKFHENEMLQLLINDSKKKIASDK